MGAALGVREGAVGAKLGVSEGVVGNALGACGRQGRGKGGIVK